MHTFIKNLLNGQSVEWKSLGEVAELKRGKVITAKEATQGNIPVISGGQKPAYYTGEHNREGETITVAGSGAYAGFVMYWNEPIFVGDAFSIKPDTELLLTRYVYHFLINNQSKIFAMKKGSGVPHVYPKDVGIIKLPIPPLPVQQKIVQILDAFTTTTAELTAEHTLRVKQYQYYRDKLLNFSDNVEWKSLGEVCLITDGDHQAPPKTNDGIPFITISNINNYNKIDFSNTRYVSKEYFDKSPKDRIPRNGDLLYTVVGSLGVPVLVDADVDFVVQRHIAIIKPKSEVLQSYLYYLLQTSGFYKNAVSNATGAAQKTIGLKYLRNVKIPVPPLETQTQIVETLDKFETLTHSISEGLPREIELRQKQYEYYRELLLNFDMES